MIIAVVSSQDFYGKEGSMPVVFPSFNPAGLIVAGSLLLQNWLCSDRQLIVPAPEQHCPCTCECATVSSSRFWFFIWFVAGALVGIGVYHGLLFRPHRAASLRLGRRFVLILYPGERKWHERLIVLRPTPSSDPRTVGWCVTATPDGDVYGEPIAPPNVEGFAVLAPDRSLPPGLLRRNVYRLEDGDIGQPPSPAELAHLRGLAQAELNSLQMEIDATGAGAVVAAAPAAPAAVLAAAPAAGGPCGYCWVGLGRCSVRGEPR